MVVSGWGRTSNKLRQENRKLLRKKIAEPHLLYLQTKTANDLCKEKLPNGIDFRRHAYDVHRKKAYILEKNKESICCDECGKIFKVKLIYNC